MRKIKTIRRNLMNPMKKHKTKGGFMKKLFLLIGLGFGVSNANIDIILEDEINFANSQGVLNAMVTSNNQTFQALGTYKVSKDLKVVFEVDRLMKGQKLSMLDKKPRVTRKLNSTNAKLPKGTKITLKGEDKKEFRDFAEQIKNLEISNSSSNLNRNNKIPTNPSGTSGGGSSGSGGGSIGNVSIGSGGSTGNIQPPYVTPSYTTPSVDADGNLTTEIWSSQFCKVPEFLENAIALSVVDKDGSCVEKMAVRDDTKCEYRFDFANNKAIKQTQFYYVDNENKVQNVGDCVDLVGAEYEAELYKDDTRCSLEHIDKDYNGGKASFFVTQILFRGIDGLIHEATDCIAYGNVKEELVEHIKDDVARTAQRVVNQYYIDPYTNEKVYLTKGVRTDAIFNYVENACGDWEMDDVAKQGKKRTEIVFYDDVEYKQFNVTSCDFSTQGGKKSEYVVAYQNLSSTYKEKELSRKSETFEISEQKVAYQQYEWRTCKSCWGIGTCCDGTNRSKYVSTYNSGKINWTTTYVEKDVTDYETWLRPDGTQYQYNKDPSGATFKRIDREIKVNSNPLNLSNDWLLYWEIHNKYYSDTAIQNSVQYNAFLSTKVKSNGCQSYTIKNYDTWGEASCNKPLGYILSNL